LHTRFGYKPLSRAWAKAEILLGLTAFGVGQMLGPGALVRAGVEAWGLAGAALALVVLGGYLTLAGHRSHLYQSANEQTALLLEERRRTRRGGDHA
jgi:hypothetical protein